MNGGSDRQSGTEIPLLALMVLLAIATYATVGAAAPRAALATVQAAAAASLTATVTATPNATVTATRTAFIAPSPSPPATGASPPTLTPSPARTVAPTAMATNSAPGATATLTGAAARMLEPQAALTTIQPSAPSGLVLHRGEPDRRFDIVTFNCPGRLEDHLCQPQFDALNWVSRRGHFLAMGSDAHRGEVLANGNDLAVYYDTLTDGWTRMTGAEKADHIHYNWVLARFTASGPPPQWIILNEISASQWPNTPTYRAWLKEVVATLSTTYGYNVILASPFANPGRNDADWQAVSAYAYIAVEQYLSGAAIHDNGFSVGWCESQYRGSQQSYLNRGVPPDRLFLIEHFGQTIDRLPDGTPVTWGRKLVSFEDWDRALQTRAAAAKNVGFAGFVSFAWAKNAMGVSDDELLHFERTYRSARLP
jgi:hypothetical protein